MLQHLPLFGQLYFKYSFDFTSPMKFKYNNLCSACFLPLKKKFT